MCSVKSVGYLIQGIVYFLCVYFVLYIFPGFSSHARVTRCATPRLASGAGLAGGLHHRTSGHTPPPRLLNYLTKLPKFCANRDFGAFLRRHAALQNMEFFAYLLGTFNFFANCFSA